MRRRGEASASVRAGDGAPGARKKSRRENPLLQTAAVLCAAEHERAPKRRIALWCRFELALLEIQRWKPPHIAALERHRDRRIQNRRRTTTIPRAAVHLGKQRQVVR